MSKENLVTQFSNLSMDHLGENKGPQSHPGSITPTTYKGSKPLEFDFDDFAKLIEEKRKSLNNKIEKIALAKKDLLLPFQQLEDAKIISDGESQSYQQQVSNIFTSLDVKKTKTEKQKKALDFQALTLQQLSPDIDFIYVEEFTNQQDNSAIRYSIEPHSLVELVTQYNENIAEHINDTVSVSSSRKSSKSRTSNKSTKNAESTVELHPIEVLIAKKALDHLTISRCVIIDIFARNNDATIKFDGDIPETHAVVLYKNTDKEIIAIDPTNSEYSKHLSSRNNMAKIIEDSQEISITTPRHKIQIYTPVKEKTGPNPDQYRDCIDISVKLVFALNKYQEEIDTKDIASSRAIQETTNSAKINGNLIIEDAIAARIIQASDDNIRSDVNMLIMNMAKQLIAAEYSEKLTSTIKENIINYLKAEHAPEEYSKGVISLFESFKKNSIQIHDAIDDWALTLQGDLCTKHLEDL